jgi:Mrp family chromosome partitioning ATPase
VQVENEATRVLARDQSRRFASTLMRNCSRGSRKSFAFASVNVGGGASAAVLDISSTLASLGCRVLVVDANSLTMGSPFASTSAGLTDLLAGNSQAVDVIHKQMHKGLALDVIPYGNSRESGIQRLDVFKSNLEEWSRVYDMVLVDIPPILPSADAELLIDTIGQVFVVVEAGSASKSGVARAGQQLRKISPEAVGLIVNKVPMENGGADLRAQVVETITRGRFQNFMTLAPMGLQVEMLKMRLQRLYSKLRHARAVRSSPQ